MSLTFIAPLSNRRLGIVKLLSLTYSEAEFFPVKKFLLFLVARLMNLKFKHNMYRPIYTSQDCKNMAPKPESDLKTWQSITTTFSTD